MNISKIHSPTYWLFSSILVLGCLVIHCAPTQTDVCIEALYNAKQAGDALPLASKCYSEELTDAQAYNAQKEFVDKLLVSEQIAGFKAGVTSTTAQQRINANGPMMAVLFESGELRSGDSISTSLFVRGIIEVELGYKLKSSLSKPVSIEELKEIVSEITPVIELPDIGFQMPSEMKATDVISGNVGSSYFVTSALSPSKIVDPNDLSITLSKGQQIINTANPTDALGDQWSALQWLVNKVIEQGYTIEPDHILITGALGTSPPMESGTYNANYGEQLGTINFSIK